MRTLKRISATTGCLPRYLTRFGRREDGSMTIFGIFMLMSMLAIVGIGVDVMRFERERAHLQNTLDRAVLAAADLEQPLPPGEVVADYFAKAGLSDALSAVNVSETLGSRTVSATARSDLRTFFMHFSGVDSLSVASASTAQESIDAVEISLVLDVSGSMRNYSRLTNLKTAAKDFVDEMFDNSEAGTVTISIVPYATQVTAPEELFDELNVMFDRNSSTVEELEDEDIAAAFSVNDPVTIDGELESNPNPALNRDRYNGHVLSHCINFDGSDFNNTTISTTDAYERTLHFDPWEDFDGRDNDPIELIRSPVCESAPSRQMMLLSDDRDALKSFIDSFYADGNTSLDVGMKWGSILVDPTFQPIAEALADEEVGLIDAQYSNRPVAHTDGETVKVVVLMTDGQNTNQYYIEDDYRLGESPIWWNESEEFYSVYLGEDLDDENNNGLTVGDPLYYWPYEFGVDGSGGYQDHAYGEGSYEETETTYECRRYRRDGSCRRWREVTTTTTIEEPGEAKVVRYEDLWAYTSMERIVEKLFEPIVGSTQAWNDWYYDAQSSYGRSTKDVRTQNICDATKTNGTIVFTIGFESPAASTTLLRNCASSPAHFFDVDGLEITDAFSAIASSIRALRLTQ